MIQIKRAYDSPSVKDGTRFLVDRLWPRAVQKTSLKLESWLKDVAPTPRLRQWFGHDPTKWDEFKRRYFAELKANPAAWQPIVQATRTGTVTLIYSARDTEHNNAVALREFLQEHLHGKRARSTEPHA